VNKNMRSALGMAVSWILLVLTISGCGFDAGRQGLQGTVTLDGKPLPQGTIRFIPTGGTGGPSAGGEVTDGEFEIESSKGVLPGSFRVEITASRKTGRKVRDRATGEMTEMFAQHLPPRYNVNSELTAEVKSGGSDPFEFALHSR
jgi:hypothetical protein